MHAYSVLPHEVDFFVSVLRNLKCPADLETRIVEQCCVDVNKMQLQRLREIIMTQILMYYLSLSEEDAQVMLDGSSNVKKSSLTSLKRVLEIYVHDVGLALSTVRVHQWLILQIIGKKVSIL